MGNFNPAEHLMKLKGKDYLEVKWRIIWMREEHPDWGIATKPLKLEVTPDGKGTAVYHATITDDQGRTLAEGTKHENFAGFPDFIEKAETGAIGRALALCGYGTQFVGDEFDEGDRLADSPVERAGTPQRAAPAPQRNGPTAETARPKQTVNGTTSPTPPVSLYGDYAPRGCDTGTLRAYLVANGFELAPTAHMGQCIAAVESWASEYFEGDPKVVGTGQWDPQRREHKCFPSDVYNFAAHHLALCEDQGDPAVAAAAGREELIAPGFE